MASSAGACGLDCFSMCGISLDLPEPGGDTTNVSGDLHDMATCMHAVCDLDFRGNSTGQLMGLYRTWMAGLNSSYDPSNCTQNPPFRVASDVSPRYAVPILGYLSPILVFLTVINNSLVCIVLLKPHMRGPTNAILVAMAISDMLTGLFPTPIFLHFHATERFYEWVPYSWCHAVQMFSLHIPTIFHTASIWLTMALAIQRYIYVCHSFKARTLCTIRNVVYGTVAIYFFSVLTHVTRFFDAYNVEAVSPSLLRPDRYTSSCVSRYARFLDGNLDLYFNIYFWFRVVFIHLMPCVSLVVMNALLIYAMRMARVRRMQLLRQNKNSESRKLKESNCTTLMLVAVVGLFLLVEFPLALLIIFVIVDQSFGIVIVSKPTLSLLSLFSNFFILLSYPLNFFIYCGMSKQFRETFKQLFTGAPSAVDKQEYSQYMTLPTENGKSTSAAALTNVTNAGGGGGNGGGGGASMATGDETAL